MVVYYHIQYSEFESISFRWIRFRVNITLPVDKNQFLLGSKSLCFWWVGCALHCMISTISWLVFPYNPTINSLKQTSWNSPSTANSMADLMLKLFQLLLCFASNAMQFARQTPDRNRIYTIGPPLPTLITKANIYILPYPSADLFWLEPEPKILMWLIFWSICSFFIMTCLNWKLLNS